MKNKVELWKELNHDALQLCREILNKLRTQGPNDIFAHIYGAFLHKAIETLAAVNVLYETSLEEQAQILVRVLFELRITFDCFLHMASKNTAADACRRVIDSMMLEKIKQARASDFVGIPSEVKQNLEKVEDEIKLRYSPEDVNRMRKHGFTGLPIEQRASMTGHEQAYSIVYRNFSRNVHSTDYVENYLKTGIYKVDDWDEYRGHRDVAAHYTAHFAAVGMVAFANHVFHLGFEKELGELGKRQQLIKRGDVDLAQP